MMRCWFRRWKILCKLYGHFKFRHFAHFPSNGAIRRCKQEEEDSKVKTHMTYNAFVEGLDEGDSFTTTLIEILVKVR